MEKMQLTSVYGEVLWEGEADTVKQAVEKAVRVGARLDGARLDGARLDGASLDGASLDGIREDFCSVLNVAPDEVVGLSTTDALEELRRTAGTPAFVDWNDTHSHADVLRVFDETIARLEKTP